MLYKHPLWSSRCMLWENRWNRLTYLRPGDASLVGAIHQRTDRQPKSLLHITL
jgi:hypothetical protein